jgi:hypothetical protein
MGLGRESLQRFWTFDPKRELGLSQLTRGIYTIGEKRSPGAGQLVDLTDQLVLTIFGYLASVWLNHAFASSAVSKPQCT